MKSRTQHSAQNAAFAAISRTLAMLMGFAARVVFTHTLSQDYVGVNGLFYDIINVFSTTELGVTAAVAYELYDPIARGDIEKQQTLLTFYKRFYHGLAVAVLLIGIAMLPLVKLLLRTEPEVDHIYLIYLMFVADAVISYFWMFKKTLLDAYQLSYISTIYQTMGWVVQTAIQILVLLLTHNYILYLSLLLVSTLISSYLTARKTDQLFPFARKTCAKSLSESERHTITQNVKAIFLHKFGDIAVNNTDNLLLSSIIGIVAAGMYSNYYLIIESIRRIYAQVFQAIAASVGNLGVLEERGKVREIFLSMCLLGHWIYGMTAVTMYEVIDLFVGVSFGKLYVFRNGVTLILCVNFYMMGLCQAAVLFRDSLGLFYYDRYKSIAAAVINLAASVFLGIRWGTVGVFLGTLISIVSTTMWVEPLVLYRRRFKDGFGSYFVKLITYLLSTACIGWLCHLICGTIHVGVIWGIVLRFVICVVITNTWNLLLFARTKEFQVLWSKLPYFRRGGCV